MLDRSIFTHPNILFNEQKVYIDEARRKFKFTDPKDLFRRAETAHSMYKRLNRAYPILNPNRGIRYDLIPGLRFKINRKHTLFVREELRSDLDSEYCHCTKCRTDIVKLVHTAGTTCQAILDWMAAMPKS